MLKNRRDFLKKGSLFAGALLIPQPWALFSNTPAFDLLTPASEGNFRFFHSSDLNGQLSADTNGYGGLEAISRSIKDEIVASLLLDSGDFLSGRQDLQRDVTFIKNMGNAGYTCANLGVNELKTGEAYLASLLPHFSFSLLNCNYSFSDEAIRHKVKRSLILEWKGKRIGITGVGPKIEGIVWNDPYAAANEMAENLKQKEGVDLVLCLSHLEGHRQNAVYNNAGLAERSALIDFIIGGHSEKYVLGNRCLKNSVGKDVILCQGGPGGSLVGSLDISLDESRNVLISNTRQIIPGLKDPSQLARVVHQLNTRLA